MKVIVEIDATEVLQLVRVVASVLANAPTVRPELPKEPREAQ